MNKDKYLSIVANGESLTVEFKQSFDKEAIETISAFANTKGGYLFIGIKDDGKICGVDVGAETIQNYINQIKNSTEPSLIVDVDKIMIDSKIFLTIKIDEFPIKPVSFKGVKK